MNKRKRLYLLIIAGGAILVAIGIASRFGPHKQQVTYVTAPAVVQDMESTVLASGIVRASELVSVGSQVSGQIQTMNVALGERVKKGQLIATIDSTPEVNALHTADAALRTAHALLRSSEATLVQTRKAWQRQNAMVAHDAAAQQDLETAQASYAAAQANTDAQHSQIDSARIAVETAQANMAYTRIVAPVDGTVVAILAVRGQTVNANQTTPNIVKLANLDTVSLKVQISEADVIRVQPGQMAYFTILGDPGKRYETTLRTVEPAPDSIKSDDSESTGRQGPSSASAVYYNGLMDVANPDHRLRISMTAQVSIVVATAHHALIIPSSSLLTELPGSPGSLSTVRLLGTDGRPVMRRVKVGLDDRTSAQILDGLKPGDRVIVGESRADAQENPWNDGGPS